MPLAQRRARKDDRGMSQFTHLIQGLQAGHTVVARPRGTSMTPLIESGQEVCIVPLLPGEEIRVGNVVLCRVHGTDYLHLVKAVDGDRVQIGNNHGHVNGWTSRAKVYGKVI